MAEYEISGLQPYSGLTHADMIGLLAGMERMDGEGTDEFLDRVRSIIRQDRTLSWKSAVLELAARLNLSPYPAFRMTFDAACEVRIGWSGLRIVEIGSGRELVRQPMLEVSPSGLIELVPFRRWMEAFEGVALISVDWNVNPEDPAAQVIRQSNRRWWDLELRSRRTPLPGGEYLEADSFVFSQMVSGWTLQRDGAGWRLELDRDPAPGLRVRYSSLSSPFIAAACPVVLAAGSDPEFRQACMAAGSIPEQLLSALREVMERDRSYWAR